MADLLEAVESGDQRMALEAIRERLARELEAAAGKDVAPIAKELRAVLDALNAMPGGEESKLDQLQARRESRRADTESR
ncbi:hypothetical protein ACFV0L_29275 [Streptosporangium canum]|jgi:hypothetical protein|uniref:hypothetical protein n=1 Tax=Streptosporangium canum TaxID=324952 RepID=UPI0036AC4939